jgi:cellulose synthase (UDP-forming)
MSSPSRVEVPGAAPSSNIAIAARAFGDKYPPLRGQFGVRVAGLFLVLVTVFYTQWMLRSLNEAAPWLSWPFAVANLFSVGYGLLAVVNAWSRQVPKPRALEYGSEPEVGIIIPTCGEPVPMILRTIASVLEQDWPADRMTVVVSDDGHDPELDAALVGLPVLYHSPPDRLAPGRGGAAKAGNLNSALAFLQTRYPQIGYIETRDADDESGTTAFLRQTVGQLESDPKLAFVQTIKQAQVAAGDPFNNWEPMFYRGQMLARNAANAVFPCGSGVVWRRAALREIGDFPTWNLVEDVHSGLEALRLGWRGMYLPIVGAVAQHAPEDVPNFYKQRGTWAIDTVRLMVWRRLRGLTLRQKAQFWEMLAFYLNAFTSFVYVPCISFALLGTSVLVASGTGYLTHLLPLVLATELWLLILNLPYNDRRRRQRKMLRKLWQTRVMWIGMAPVYAKAVILAVVGGPNRKPAYTVTRKHDDLRWHWRHTLPQTMIAFAVLCTAIYALRFGTSPNLGLLAATVYWGGLHIALLTSFISRSWHGLARTRRAARRLRTASAAAPGSLMSHALPLEGGAVAPHPDGPDPNQALVADPTAAA